MGLGQSRQAPKAVSDLLLEQPFPGHQPACLKSTVLCDLPARAVPGAKDAVGTQGRRWRNLSPMSGLSGSRKAGEWEQGASHSLAARMCPPGPGSLKGGLLCGDGCGHHPASEGGRQTAKTLNHLHRDVGSTAHRQLSCLPRDLRATGTLSQTQEQVILGLWAPLPCPSASARLRSEG